MLFPAITHLYSEVWCWKNVFPVTWRHRTQFRDDEFISLVQPWCFFVVVFLTHKAAPALHVTAQHTQTLTDWGEAENSEGAFVSLVSQAVLFVLLKAPG